MSKTFIMVALNCLTANFKSYLSEKKPGFKKDTSTVQQILTLRFHVKNTPPANIKCYITASSVFKEQSIVTKLNWLHKKPCVMILTSTLEKLKLWYL